MRTACYLIDLPRSGLDNMAMDQAMLEQTAGDGIVRLRFYEWSEPTVSLGYFQRYSEYLKRRNVPVSVNLSDPSADSCESGLPPAIVRRATGGGAIVHHYDWTYSIAIPAEMDEQQKTVGASCGLYYRVHEAVVSWLNCSLEDSADKAALWKIRPESMQLDAGCAASHGGQCASGANAFLCFDRRSPGDVIVGPHKVMGSAQRRHRSAVLQHGSLLLATSPFAPSLKGLRQLGNLAVPGDGPGDAVWKAQLFKGFAEKILDRIAECYPLQLRSCGADEAFVTVREEIRKRLESPSWIARI